MRTRYVFSQNYLQMKVTWRLLISKILMTRSYLFLRIPEPLLTDKSALQDQRNFQDNTCGKLKVTHHDYVRMV